ncbi:MAG: hypothetical protein EOM25_07775 [Deltaproteobacteria bacterium]|nr:hypothetical protein [Deltaproteobacteria bacterium]
MTVNSVELPLVIVQTPEVQKLHDMVRNSPEAQQSMAEHLMREQQKRDRSSVSKPEKTDKSVQAQVDDRREGASGQGLGHDRKRRSEAETDDSERQGLLDVVV